MNNDSDIILNRHLFFPFFGYHCYFSQIFNLVAYQYVDTHADQIHSTVVELADVILMLLIMVFVPAYQLATFLVARLLA